MEEYAELENKIKEINSLEEVQGVLSWDQEVVMPDKGIKARSKQMSLISQLKHDLIADKGLEKLIKRVEDNKENLNDDQKANLREFKRKQEKEVKIPKELKKEISETSSESVKTWAQAKEENDFEMFLPYLRKMISLKRQYANHLDPDEETYKVLFRDYEPYMSFERMEEILEELKAALTDKLDEIKTEGSEIETEALKGDFDVDKQEDLARKVVEKLGFNWDKGVLYTSSHPFTSGNQMDTRITSRYDPENMAEGFTAAIHEAGHGLYQQGLPEKNHGLPTGDSREIGFHESQSKLYEDQIGRSQVFWKFAAPMIKEKFDNFDYTPEECYESVNQIKPENKIRIEADELTYHLHIILRFELGRDLVNGDLEPENLPEAWNDKMENLLGVRPDNDAEGCLQDIHWSWGNFGYFPTYSQGSVLAAQIYNQMEKDIDNLEEKIENGDFTVIQNWLDENIYQHGRRYKTEEFIEKITGEKPTAEYFIEHIEEKFNKIYEL